MEHILAGQVIGDSLKGLLGRGAKQRSCGGRQGATLRNSAHGLTLREMSILTLLSKGLTADDLARRLGISPRTPGKHLEHMYRKLDVHDRLMAVQRAYEPGLLTPRPTNTTS